MSDGKIPVLHFTYSQVYAGAEEHMVTLLRGLDRQRFRPLLACHPRLLEEIRHTLPEDVEVFPLRLEGLTSFRAAWQLSRILKQQRIEILHSHMFHSSLLASPVGWISGVPVIVETPHVAERWRKGWIKGNFFVDRLVSKLVTYHIAVSRSNAEYLLLSKGLNRAKVIVIRNGCDLARFAPDRRAPLELRKALGLHDGDLSLLVPARLEPQKGHSILLEALPAVLREFPKLKAVFVGDGSLRKSLERQSRDLGLDSCVRFVGFKPGMADWYAAVDLMVLPSFYEGLPLVAIESLAAGCPVVATAVDGTPEVVVNGETGITVPPGEPGPLADAICWMFRHPQMRRAFGRRGRELVEAEFDQAKQIRETADLYRLGLDLWRREHGHSIPQAEHVGEPAPKTLVARR